MTLDITGQVPRINLIDALTRSTPASRRTLEAPIICLSHLRWDFVFQRPQHLMTRLAQRRDVLYVEEPVPCDGPPTLATRIVAEGVTVAVPHLPRPFCAAGDTEGDRLQQQLLAPVIAELERLAGQSALAWYYTPMSLGLVDGLSNRVVVYDCMDELSGFHFAPPTLIARERELLKRADIVFTGGRSLYQAKRHSNPNVHAFPSSVDRDHFATALKHRAAGTAQKTTATGPRVGWCGVIDERLDVGLLASVVAARPDWEFIMLGPVVKIDPASLPRAANIHWIGARPYAELPSHLAGWDAAMMPFALNEATRFISPTKTPEFLAAGLAVASTSVTDVIDTWGGGELVHIGDGAAFVTAIESALADGAGSSALVAAADRMLEGMSWDRTVLEMDALLAAIAGTATDEAAETAADRTAERHRSSSDGHDASALESTWTI